MDGRARGQTAAIRRRFAALLTSGPSLDLVEGALLIAAEEYPELDIAREACRVASICEEAARRVAPHSNPFARLDALSSFLFEDLGFHGNSDQYDDPRNSYLNDVLDRRLGIPLSLSILYIEAARRAGFEARGIGLPGHFVVGIEYAERSLLVDPFHGGHLISEEDCRELVIRTTGRASMYRRDLLDGTTPRAMLTRLLLNLKRIYLAREDYTRSLAAVDRLLMISPDDAKEVRDRGFLLAHLGRPGAAVADLEAYLALAPGAPDANSVRGRVAWLVRKMSEIH